MMDILNPKPIINRKSSRTDKCSDCLWVVLHPFVETEIHAFWIKILHSQVPTPAYLLKTALKSCILLNVLPVILQCSCTNASKLVTSQCWLEEICRIQGPCCTPCKTHSAVSNLRTLHESPSLLCHSFSTRKGRRILQQES